MVQVSQHDSTVMGVALSEAAKAHVIKYLAKRELDIGLRLSLSKTGCSGLAYQVDYVDEQVDDDLAFAIDDNYQVFIERKSYPHLKGVKIDYVQQGLNYKFVFTNPNQTGACGCGESFTIE